VAQIDYLFANKTSCRHFQKTIKDHRAEVGDVLNIPGAEGKLDGGRGFKTDVVEVENKSE
jgi:hypothetical protein